MPNRPQPLAEFAGAPSVAQESEITRERLSELLNEGSAREYQAIIAYVVYSQVLEGAKYMNIAAQFESHAKQSRWVWQCEQLGEYAEQIRKILVNEQDHQIDLATTLGEQVPDVTSNPQERRRRARV
jgi:bacterioferritin